MTHLEIAFTLNGERRRVRSAVHHTLLQMLRDDLGMLDSKEGCGEGVCGACTVLLDEEPVSSCLVLAPFAQGRKVTTVSGLGRGVSLHSLQTSFVHHGAAQCGFCTPGMILTAYAFLRDHPAPTREAIRRAIAGNLCRCTGYAKIVDAIAAAARKEESGV
jgi:aerobic-type carbon monoxide dehydrogenase small subunit (CoxS/CutS family)